MYGEGSSWRYFIGFGILIVLLIFVIVLIVHHGGGSKKVPATQRPLTSYTNDSNITVSETIIGPITAAQNHNQIDIDVSNQATNVNVSTGYDNNVTTSKTYPMSTSGFSEFLSALERANFTKGDTAADLKDDEGYCATGQRYIFEIMDGSDTIERFWATSCNGPKSYQGNLEATVNLFQAQVPDYQDLVNSTSFAPSIVGL